LHFWGGGGGEIEAVQWRSDNQTCAFSCSVAVSYHADLEMMINPVGGPCVTADDHYGIDLGVSRLLNQKVKTYADMREQCDQMEPDKVT
jgi:hypothetical protein